MLNLTLFNPKVVGVKASNVMVSSEAGNKVAIVLTFVNVLLPVILRVTSRFVNVFEPIFLIMVFT